MLEFFIFCSQVGDKNGINSVQGLKGCYSTEKCIPELSVCACVDGVGCSDEFVWIPAVCLPATPKIH